MKPPSVKLVDRKVRIVELDAPKSSAARRDTDRQLLFEPYDFHARPQSVGFCYQATDRVARFLIDKSPLGDRFLQSLESGTRPPKPYGPSGWLVQE